MARSSSFNPSRRLRVCKNCGHYMKTNREMGSEVNPHKLSHWLEGWGTQKCPHCDCNNPEEKINDK